MLGQQDLLRSLMAKLELSRQDLCDRFDIAPRRLQTWLLPSSSKGFRHAPAEFLRLIEDELIMAVDNLCMVIEFPDGWADRKQTIRGPREHPPLLFPPLYLGPTVDWTGDDPAPLELALTQRKGYKPIHKPVAMNGQPRWTYITHHRTYNEATTHYFTAYSVILQLYGYREAIWENHDTVRVGHDYFTLFSVPAPAHWPKSLFIYEAQHLEFCIPIFMDIAPGTPESQRFLMREHWSLCIDEKGKRLADIPEPPEPEMTPEEEESWRNLISTMGRKVKS